MLLNAMFATLRPRPFLLIASIVCHIYSLSHANCFWYHRCCVSAHARCFLLLAAKKRPAELPASPSLPTLCILIQCP